jgi:hypothetical protein
MLVAATGAMGAGLMAWSNSSFAIQSLQISNQTASRINLVKETFVVEDVWFRIDPDDSAKYADVTVRNTGDLAVTVSNIYVNNSRVWDTDQTVSIGSVVKIQNVPVDWGSGNVQSVLVETERGTMLKQDWKS